MGMRVEMEIEPRGVEYELEQDRSPVVGGTGRISPEVLEQEVFGEPRFDEEAVVYSAVGPFEVHSNLSRGVASKHRSVLDERDVRSAAGRRDRRSDPRHAAADYDHVVVDDGVDVSSGVLRGPHDAARVARSPLTRSAITAASNVMTM